MRKNSCKEESRMAYEVKQKLFRQLRASNPSQERYLILMEMSPLLQESIQYL